jgi:hypothetical protein|tara:strand:+ start:1385 stop:1591 length:207 start_codon:yes stop_codon:yes gene_type:complete
MDLGTLKKLAGIDQVYSPVEEENPSHTATALKQKERKLGLKPGDPDWFKLWFRRPYLQGSKGFRGRKK